MCITNRHLLRRFYAYGRMTSFRFNKMSGDSKDNRSLYRTVIVEGNIASGKTALLEHFRKFPKFTIFPEPVAAWQNLKGHNMLDLLYKDSSRWSFAFQMYADLTRLDEHKSTTDLQKGDVKLIERSLYSGKYCFAETLFRSGKLHPAEYAVHCEYFDWILKNFSEILRVDTIIYLRTKPEVCYERLLKRSRKEESSVPLDYVKTLHEHYEDWLIRRKHPVPAKVIEVDANRDLSELRKQYDKLVQDLSE